MNPQRNVGLPSTSSTSANILHVIPFLSNTNRAQDEVTALRELAQALTVEFANGGPAAEELGKIVLAYVSRPVNAVRLCRF